MPRGYRCILVAFVGWLSLAAAQPQQGARQPQSGTSNDIAAALENVAASLSRDNEASQHDQPCDQGRDNRKSDLCAQWKAADAAESTAKATWTFGYIGTLIGLLTLAAAGAAAWYARKAAIHTEESAREAKRAADAAESQLEHAQHTARPYLSPLSETFTLNENEDGAIILAVFEFRNTGNTPAQQALFRSENNIEFYEGSSAGLTDGVWLQGMIAPQAPVTIEYEFPLLSDQLKALRENRCQVNFRLSAAYTNTFGETWTYRAAMKLNTDSLRDGIIFTQNVEQHRAEGGESKDESATHQPSLDLKDGQ